MPNESSARALVVTVSDRAARGEYADRSGPILVAGLADLGLQVTGPTIVPDGPAVGAALTAAVAEGYDIVITTGGTGVSPSDRTPEQTAPLLDRPLPGIAEALRAYGVAAGMPAAMLSRGLAGLAGSTVIVNAPGSTGGCRDALAVLGPVLGHLLDQVRGGDHGDHGRREA